MSRLTGRRFIQYGLGTGAALAVPWATPIPAARGVQGGKLTKYVQPVPVPGAGIVVATPSGPIRFSFTQTEISRQLHPNLAPTPLTGALDSETGDQVLSLLRDRCEAGAAALLVTHEARHAGWADRVVFLLDGAIVDQASPETPDVLLADA